MAERLPYYPYYVDDITKATGEMTDEQFGAYQRLLNHAWVRGGLPTDEIALRAIRNWSRGTWARLWPAIGPKWVRQGERLVNERQEVERVKAAERLETAHRAAAASAESRAAARARAQANAQAEAATRATANGKAGATAHVAAISDLQISEKPQEPERSEGDLDLREGSGKPNDGQRAPAEDGRNERVKTHFKTPEPPGFKRLCALVKAGREKYPDEPVPDFIEYCKVECAKAGFTYDGGSIGRALEAVEAAARRKQ